MPRNRSASRSSSNSLSSDDGRRKRHKSKSSDKRHSSKDSKHHSEKHHKDKDRGRDEEEAERQRAKAKLNQEKQLRKMLETPEERRRRRLEKKEHKHRKYGGGEDEEEKSHELFGYTNEANPFGDPNLLTPFQWNKKHEVVAKKTGRSVEEIAEENARKRRREVKDEVEKVKRRRAEREAEHRQWEEEKARMAREAEGINALDWERKEEEFHHKQDVLRSKIRLGESRAKPIDILTHHLELPSDNRNNNNNNNDPSAVDEIVDIREPYHVFKGLHIFELEDLKQDIEARIAAQTHVDYWQALLIVCEDTLTAARAEEHANPNAQTGDRFATTGVHRVIEKDILEDLSGKSYDELRELQESISNKLEQGGVDAEYWEALLKRVVVQRAKAKLSDIHADLLRKKLALLQSQQIQRIRALNEEDEIVRLREEAEGKQMQPDDKSETQNNSDDDGKGETRQATKGRKSGGKQRTANKQTSETDAEYVCPPSPIANYKPEKDEIVWNASDDEREITQLREQVLFTVKQRAKDDEDVLRRAENKRIDDMVKAEAERGMENGDSAFNIEVPLGTSDQVVWWHDKYRPRKPRYFNRVHTGFEWNKYNQTHYDHDNPPPKTVQGYKFNIFYPDLIDPTQTPRYFIEPGENPDVAMIRFHAGPPYEDIAFKIVNKEFDTGRKSGYKCTFDRGVLHLYFNFKRHRYRR